jgi:hypothetical protein
MLKVNKERKGDEKDQANGNLHLHNIVAAVTNNRIPGAGVNLILVPVCKLCLSGIQLLLHVI